MPTITRSFTVGPYTVTARLDEGSSTAMVIDSASWSPSVPRRPLSQEERAAYIAGRTAAQASLEAEVGRALGRLEHGIGSPQ